MSRIRRHLSVLLLFLIVLTSCADFLGFSEFPQPNLGSITIARLNLTDRSLRKLYDSVYEDDYAPCIYDEDGRRIEALVKIRGFTSRLEHRKNFTILIQDGPEEIRYALDASGYSIKNALAMYAYRMVGLPAPATKPVALFVNGEYLGCYTRLDMYTERNLREHYGKTGELFKCLFPDLGSDYPLQGLSEKKFPDDNDFSSLNLFVYNAKNMEEPEWSAWVERYVDSGEIIRYMVVHDFLAVYDTGGLNFYVFNYGKVVILPWDNELSMQSTVIDLWGDNLLTRRIVENPARRSLYNSEMRRLFIDPGLGNILDQLIAEANRTFSEIEQAVLNDPFIRLSPAEIQNENQKVLDFLNERPGNLDPLVPPS